MRAQDPGPGTAPAEEADQKRNADAAAPAAAPPQAVPDEPKASDRAQETADDPEEMGFGTAGGIARRLENRIDQVDNAVKAIDEGLDEWVQDQGGSVASVIGATVASSALTLFREGVFGTMKDALNMAHLGEGIGSGTLEGALEDVGRLADLLPGVGALRRGGKAAARFRRRLGFGGASKRPVKIVIDYDLEEAKDLRLDPKAANFMRACLEYGQGHSEELGKVGKENLLAISSRKKGDKRAREKARERMREAKKDIAGTDASHNVDSVVNPHFDPDTGTFYFAKSEVNQAFGRLIHSKLAGKLGTQSYAKMPGHRGRPVKVVFKNFPKYSVVPPETPKVVS